MVEFALLAAPFLGVVFVILNTALVFFAQQALENATTQAARLIMTGQAQKQNMTAAQFKAAMCGFVSSLLSCDGITVNVKTSASFAAATLPIPIVNGQLNKAGMGYAPGVAGDIVVVQSFYQWPLFATGLGYNFANLSGAKDLIVASAAFRNEPFQ